MHPYMIEQLAALHRQDLLRTAEQHRLAANRTTRDVGRRDLRQSASRQTRALAIFSAYVLRLTRRRSPEPATPQRMVDLTSRAAPTLLAATAHTQCEYCVEE